MDKIIVYLDDVGHAQQQLAPMVGGAAPTHWVLVACPPRLTRRVSKWVSYSARESWRAKWAEKAFARVVPALLARGDKVTPCVAHGNLPELTRKLVAEHGAARVLDARRPKFGQDLAPVTAEQPPGTASRWEVPGAIAGLGAMLVLAAE